MTTPIPLQETQFWQRSPGYVSSWPPSISGEVSRRGLEGEGGGRGRAGSRVCGGEKGRLAPENCAAEPTGALAPLAASARPGMGGARGWFLNGPWGLQLGLRSGSWRSRYQLLPLPMPLKSPF